MNALSLSARLAVCSWSLQPTSPQRMIAAVKATGLSRVQLDLDADIAAARVLVEGIQ